MTRPVRIQRKRTKGFSLALESRAINGLPVAYVGRPTMWGNRYQIGTHSNYLGRAVATLAEAVECYRAVIWPEPHHKAWIRENLAGKNLACWCPLVCDDGSPHPCHADVLLDLANPDAGAGR